MIVLTVPCLRLHARSFPTGNTFTVGGISGLIILPFGNFFVRLFGEINLIVFAIFLEASRYVMMALIT